MFITREVYKSPASAIFAGSETLVWSAAELGVQQSWFLAQLEESDAQKGDGHASIRTIFLFDFTSVEHFLHSNQDDRIRLKSVHIVTPGHVNGSNGWQMDQLRAVWQGREVIDEHEVPTNIFETVSGRKYPATYCGATVEELAGDTLKFQLPH